MVRLIFHLVLAASRYAAALCAAPITWVRDVWPEAFPVTSPQIRSQGELVSREDGKPLARRLLEYAHRLAERLPGRAGPWLATA
jgi:hypothetical protein